MLTALKPLNRFRQNLKQRVTSATRPLMPNLVFVIQGGGRVPVWVKWSPLVSMFYLSFLLVGLLAHLPRSHRSS